MKDFECYGEDSARRHRVDCVRRQIHQDLMHLGQLSQHNMGGGTLIKCPRAAFERFERLTI